MITDDVGTWEELGVLMVSDQWQLFPVAMSGSRQTFRITTSILNKQDWQQLKIRSASYIRFYYPDGSTSSNLYLPVSENKIIRDFSTPDLDDTIIKQVGCILSHPKIGRYSLESYARWNLKLEVLL